MDQPKTIKFKFHGKKESLKIVDTHQELSEYLSNQSFECPLIGSEIKIGRLLGKGKFGEAYVITTPEFGSKEYAAKRIDKSMSSVVSKKSGSLESVAKYISKEHAVSKESVIALNKNTFPDGHVSIGDDIYVPIYSKVCLTKKEETIEPHDKEGKKTLVPAKSYVCEDETYPEFIISSLCGNLFKKKVSINFFDTFGFANCPSKDGQVSQYVFMEKIDTTLKKLLKKRENFQSFTIAVLMIQVIHAIGVYQKEFKLQHTDLSTKNVFIEEIKPTTKFNDANIQTAEYFRYDVGDKPLYLPYIPWIVKIGDFGMSVKYSYPIVAPKNSLRGAENIPNWYTKNYDILFFVNNMFTHHNDDLFVRKICKEILKMSRENTKGSVEEIETLFYNFFSLESGRPESWTLEKVFNKITPESILTNTKIVGKFLKPQKNAVFMGKF